MANYLTTTSIAIDVGTLVGKMIVNALMQDDSLFLEFENGLNVEIFDAGQSCREPRHLSTDDDVNALIGGRLIHIDTVDIDDMDDMYDVDASVSIHTDRGIITIVNHNEHNGYRCGFMITIRQIDEMPKREAS